MSARVKPAPDNRLDAAGLPWEVFICRACGLLYDEGEGDADSGLAPGTRFADIPDDWACPLCGVSKADFEPYTAEAPLAKARKASATSHASARKDAGTVIVGAGRAGWQMAQALRDRDADMPITLVTSCSGDVYDKPMLSVAIARGIAPEGLVREPAADAAGRLGVKLLAFTDAVRILPAARQLRTSRGTLRYRQLVLAHGARARALPQLPASLCWHINHLQAYSKFRSFAGEAPQRIAIVGAGLIGCELANDLALAGHRITLMDVADRPLASCASAERSQQLLQAWKPLPITFRGGLQIAAVEQAPAQGGRTAGRKVTTRCGQVLEVDHIIVAAGLQTPGRLADTAGLAWNNGIDVEAETLATSVEGIHALGDCIAIGGQVSRFVEPIARQAQTIAAGITGGDAMPYRRLPVPLRVKTSSLPFTV